jgi:hypothetical protein
MADLEDISVHDNFLVSYEVFCETRKIVFHTEYRDKTGYLEKTDIDFSGYNCYYFENDSVLGTIIFDIEEIDPMIVFEENIDKFASGIHYGWPGDWAESGESAKSFFDEKGLKAFAISSSCGLCGWIIATSIQIKSETIHLTTISD